MPKSFSKIILSRKETYSGAASKKRLLEIALISQKRAQKLKADFLTKFMEHEVTQDILNGMTNPKHNGLISPAPYGNLYSFLGFEYPTNPIFKIYNFFEENIDFQYTLMGFFNMQMTITIPSREEVFAISDDLPWADGAKWPEKVELGIPGIGYYFSIPGYGRSKGGFQRPDKIRGGRWKNRKYISALIRDFEKQANLILNTRFN